MLDGVHSVGGLIDVHRHGGSDARTLDLDFPPFDVGDELVLFLERKNGGTGHAMAPTAHSS